MVTDPPNLEPKTKEVWAGVRRPGSQTSQLQSEIDDLRARLSGFDAYRQFLRDQDGFTELETNLGLLAEDVQAVSEDDVERAVGVLEDAFGSWSDYKGDPEQDTGVYGLASYDEYRQYLVDAGIAEVDADEHNQVLQDLFDPDAAAGSDAGTHTDWAALQSELEANGVSSSDATETIDRLESVFASVRELDQAILIAESWSAVETDLTDRGLSSSEASSVVSDLKTAYGNTLDAATRGSFSAFESFGDFESWLVDQGFTSDESSRISNSLQDEGLTIDDVRRVLAEEGLGGLLNRMPHSEQSSDTRVGIKIWEDDGTTLTGQSASKDDVSLRHGGNLFFEEIGDPVDDVETEPESDISWSDLSVEPQAAFPGQQVRISATATNTGSTSALATGRLLIDGEVRGHDSVVVDAVGTKTVSFRLSISETGTYDVQISTTASDTLVVNHTSGNL